MISVTYGKAGKEHSLTWRGTSHPHRHVQTEEIAVEQSSANTKRHRLGRETSHEASKQLTEQELKAIAGGPSIGPWRGFLPTTLSD